MPSMSVTVGTSVGGVGSVVVGPLYLDSIKSRMGCDTSGGATDVALAPGKIDVLASCVSKYGFPEVFLPKPPIHFWSRSR